MDLDEAAGAEGFPLVDACSGSRLLRGCSSAAAVRGGSDGEGGAQGALLERADVSQLDAYVGERMRFLPHVWSRRCAGRSPTACADDRLAR